MEEKFTVLVIAHRWLFQNSQTMSINKTEHRSVPSFSLKTIITFIYYYCVGGGWEEEGGERSMYVVFVMQKSEDSTVESALSFHFTWDPRLELRPLGSHNK